MAYFNHAFRQTHVGTQGFTGKDDGKLGTAGNILAAGEYAFVDPKTWILQNPDVPPISCCPLILTSGSLMAHDKIGPFHGGYQASNKSKVINPKYVSRVWFSPACPAQNHVLHLGTTQFTAGGNLLTATLADAGTGYVTGNATVTGGTGTGATVDITVDGGGAVLTVTIVNVGRDYTDGDVLTINGGDNLATFTVTVTVGVDGCCPSFVCNETYSLRVDIKGSPALRFLNRNTYLTVDYFTGCCADDAIEPTAVDSTLVMIGWAKELVDSPLMNPFVLPIVVGEDGVAYYAPGTVDSIGVPYADTWDTYVSPGHTPDACAGLILNGAYVDTKFGDCSFQTTDFYEKEPVVLYASMVDQNGDPCAFEGLCVVTECQPRQANGFGETVLRDLILDQAYRQNFFHSDIRIREITQGDSILSAVNRNAFYNRFYIQHNVPRFNNPTSTFDNDQYLLELVVPDTVNPTDAADGQLFTTFLNGWLDACGACEGVEVLECTASCEPLTPAVPEGDVV